MSSIEEDLKILETKITQLKLNYDRYFLGTRPREPMVERAEVDKQIGIYSNTSFPRTALKFRFSSINSRYQAFKRQWIETLRKIEQGTYSRHRFKADLHESDDAARPSRGGADQSAAGADLYRAYVQARKSCGQSVNGLSPAKLAATLAKQEAAVKKRYGNAEVKYRVVVEDGKAKLKVSRAR